MKNIITLFILFMSFSVLAGKLPQIPGSELPEGKQQYQLKRGFIEKHNAFESMSLRLSLSANLKGFVEGKICDSCETMKVTITPATKAYAKNVEVPLIEAKSRVGRYATVIYELDTKNVSEIRW